MPFTAIAVHSGAYEVGFGFGTCVEPDTYWKSDASSHSISFHLVFLKYWILVYAYTVTYYAMPN